MRDNNIYFLPNVIMDLFDKEAPTTFLLTSPNSFVL